MQGLIISLAVLAVASANYDLAFDAWKLKYEKSYDSEIEENYRKSIFIETAERVMKHNVEYELGLHTYDQETNAFADMTADERKARNGFRMVLDNVNFEESEEVVVGTPTSKDWTSEGYVTSVKNQGQCGSCWAFSTAEATSSACAILQGKSTLINLSQQELVSCDRTCLGCNGGNFESGFNYYKKHGAISLADYPYTSGTGKTGSCEASGKTPVRYTTGYTKTTSGSESALQNAVGNIEPVSVAIDASQTSFSDYSSGIYYSSTCSSTSLDHAVMVTGYGANSQGQYWIVKNSWGTSWGMNGYIWMSRNRNNNCGIATAPAYPQCSKNNQPTLE